MSKLLTPEADWDLFKTPIDNFAAVSNLTVDQLSATRKKVAYRTPILERVLTLIGLDAACILIASTLSFVGWAFLSSGHPNATLFELAWMKWYWFPLAMGAWYASSWMGDLYDAAISGMNGVLIQRTLMAMAVTTVGFLAAYFLFPDGIPRTFFLLFTFLVGTLTVVARTLQHRWSDRNTHVHRMLLVGDAPSAIELRKLFSKVERMKMRLVGWTGEGELAKLHADHGFNGLYRFAVCEGVSEIIVSGSPENNSADVYRALVECQANGIRVSSMADVYRKLSRQIPIEFVDAQWVLSAMQDRVFFTRVQLGIKRAFDIVGSICALPFLILITPFVAIAIKLDSSGPVFYTQERTGRAGRKFHIVKFRTMCSDAERDGKAVWATNGDPRITRVGTFLRRTRIDELPQFVNVLWGEMSLVGPRPEREQIEERLDRELPHYFLRRLVKPGITGWAQVHYKYGNTVYDSLKKLQYDAYYVRYWSVTMDVYVILRTIGVMLGSKGQ
jgi:exopolysaccharide biosynthesis polyprenyl glycosylphosphotransferase